jgi:hypothetical protein
MRMDVEKRLWLQRAWGPVLAKLDCPWPANGSRGRPTATWAACRIPARREEAGGYGEVGCPAYTARNTSTDANINACYSTTSPNIAVDLISDANTSPHARPCPVEFLCCCCVWPHSECSVSAREPRGVVSKNRRAHYHTRLQCVHHTTTTTSPPMRTCTLALRWIMEMI